VASQIFWLMATLNVVLALGFELLVRSPRGSAARDQRVALARGQHKDNWLLCAAIWIGFASARMSGHELLMLVGAMLFAWLTRRAASRLRLLHAQA
jgi:hypothetical protein